MPDTESPGRSPSVHEIKTPAIDLDSPRTSRRYRLHPPKTLQAKIAQGLIDLLESFVARHSIHPDVPVYHRSMFPWVAEVESQWKKIRVELGAVMKRREEMPNFQDILSEAGTITDDDQWKTFFLAAPGMECRANQNRCPDTLRILGNIPGLQTAFFSILSPRKHIPSHRGAFNGVLRYHLGLVVPEPKRQCRIRIGTQIHHWEEGESLIFDDTFNHEVWNETDGCRVVLFVDFARPMRRPYAPLLRILFRLAAKMRFLREADQRQTAWERRFYRK